MSSSQISELITDSLAKCHYTTEVSIETCTRERKDVIGESKMKIRNKEKVESRGSRIEIKRVINNKCRIIDFID